MGRPFHQRSEESIRREQAGVQAIRRLLGGDEVELFGQFSLVDAAILHRGKLLAIVEVKGPLCGHNRYPTFRTDAKKLLEALRMEKFLNTKFFLVVHYDDGLFYCRPKELWPERLHGCVIKRAPRQEDPYDVDLGVELSVDDLVALTV